MRDIIENLQSPVLGMWNCHHKGIHSIVLKERPDGSLLRIFYADKTHTMNRLFSESGHFTIGAHNHDKPLLFKVLFGNVWNVDVTDGYGFGLPLYRYQFKSALIDGRFELGEPRKYICDIRVRTLDGIYMGPRAVHTVLVSSASAAWLVNECPVESVTKYIYSPRNDLTLDATGLYQPMTPEDLRRVCAELTDKINAREEEPEHA